MRPRAWDRPATDLDETQLEGMIDDIPLNNAVAKVRSLTGGKVRGRVVVRIV